MLSTLINDFCSSSGPASALSSLRASSSELQPRSRAQLAGAAPRELGCCASKEPAGPAPGAVQFAEPPAAVQIQTGQGAAPVAPAASTDNRSGKASAKAAPPSFDALIDAGTVVPDEHDGSYALSSYHANVTGGHRGYKAAAGFRAWVATNEAIMARQTSWATIDFEAEDAVDPEYMFSYGDIDGEGVAMSELRPVVIEAQEKMKEGYGKALTALIEAYPGVPLLATWEGGYTTMRQADAFEQVIYAMRHVTH